MFKFKIDECMMGANKKWNEWVHRWAVWLGLRWERLSPTAKKLMLAVFCWLSMSICIGVMVHAFRTGSVPVRGATIRFEVPRELPGMSRLPLQLPPGKDDLSPPLVIALRRFGVWLDSLEHDPYGRRLYDSIRLARPGLIDSLHIVQKVYGLSFSK